MNPEVAAKKQIFSLGFSLVGVLLFVGSIKDLSLLAGSANAFRLHHEVTTPLCGMLAKWIGGLFAGAACLALLDRFSWVGKRAAVDLASVVFLILLCLATGFVLENESFFTLYDNKSLPVHPSEIVMHPDSGWMTAGAHVFLCIAGIAGGGLFLFVTREQRSRQTDG